MSEEARALSLNTRDQRVRLEQMQKEIARALERLPSQSIHNQRDHPLDGCELRLVFGPKGIDCVIYRPNGSPSTTFGVLSLDELGERIGHRCPSYQSSKAR